jgi:hypothetical protein
LGGISWVLEAVAAASRVRGALVEEASPPAFETALVERNSSASPAFKRCFVGTHYSGLLDVFVVK